MSEPTTISAFVEMLKSHDWTYDYSDDHSVWQRGSREARAIRIAFTNQPELKPYYDTYLSWRELPWPRPDFELWYADQQSTNPGAEGPASLCPPQG